MQHHLYYAVCAVRLFIVRTPTKSIIFVFFALIANYPAEDRPPPPSLKTRCVFVFLLTLSVPSLIPNLTSVFSFLHTGWERYFGQLSSLCSAPLT